MQQQTAERWPWLGLGAFAALSIAIAVSDAMTDSLTTQDVVRVAFWLVLLALLGWGAAVTRKRARRAEDAARRMTGPGAAEVRPQGLEAPPRA